MSLPKYWALALLIAASPANASSVRVQAGAAESIVVPKRACHLHRGGPDEHLVSYSSRGQIYTIMTDGETTARFTGIPSNKTAQVVCVRGLSPSHALSAADTGWFDTKGVWLGGVYVDPAGVLHGFYHAESPIPTDCAPGTQHPYRCRTCNPVMARMGNCIIDPAACEGARCARNELAPHESIAYAESRDGGASWTKTGYPRNQIITGPPAYAQAGNVSIVPFGPYLYAYYSGEYPFVARAPLASAGRPGSWRKYFCTGDREDAGSCGFTQPGIGGRSTKVQTLSRGAYVAFNGYLGKLIEIDNAIQSGIIDFKGSSDGLHWAPLDPSPGKLAPMQAGWADIYPSIVGLGGDKTRDRQFWMYEIRQQLPLRRKRQIVRIPIRLTE